MNKQFERSLSSGKKRPNERNQPSYSQSKWSIGLEGGSRLELPKMPIFQEKASTKSKGGAYSYVQNKKKAAQSNKGRQNSVHDGEDPYLLRSPPKHVSSFMRNGVATPIVLDKAQVSTAS